MSDQKATKIKCEVLNTCNARGVNGGMWNMKEKQPN